jgi:hypothetical protein
MTHLAIRESLPDGDTAEWLEHVAEREYTG